MWERTIILKVGAVHDLWFWHAFLVYPDLTMILIFFNGCGVFAKLAEGKSSKVNYIISMHNYNNELQRSPI